MCLSKSWRHRGAHMCIEPYMWKTYAINPDFMRAFACEMAIHQWRRMLLPQEASSIQFYPVMARHQVEGSKLWEFAVYIVLASGYTVKTNTMCSDINSPDLELILQGMAKCWEILPAFFSQTTCVHVTAQERRVKIYVSSLSLSLSPPNVYQSHNLCHSNTFLINLSRVIINTWASDKEPQARLQATAVMPSHRIVWSRSNVFLCSLVGCAWPLSIISVWLALLS